VNSLERLVGILDLFEGEEGVFTAEQLHARLGYTRSTLYRYLKVLTDSGLLSSLHSVGYTLGPRITELDYRMRMRDPLIAAAKPVMSDLTREIAGIALLCRRYRDKVLCVHQDAGTDAFLSR
jgi:DNA-binding IclR family transcriptional regulator